MSNTLKIYCIYNAKSSIKGELKYLYEKYFKDIKCSMCDITHGVFTQKKKWASNCSASFLDIECLHLDELTKDIKDLVINEAPCVVAQVNSTNKIVINNKELANMGGDVDSFFSHLYKVVEI